MASQLMFMLLLRALSIAKAQTLKSKITIGSTLYTNTTPNFWPSPSGRFAFGFYPNGFGFRVGIWIVGVPNNTIVWTARRDDSPVSAGTSLFLSNDGTILLRSARDKDELISSATQRASYASMIDSGNFVLYNSSSQIIWSSFYRPTDTILVRQSLLPANQLYSSFSQTDHSIGRFRIAMLNDGNLVAYPVSGWNTSKDAYWSTGTKDGGYDVSLNLNEHGRLYLRNNTGFDIKNLTAGGLPSNGTFIYRATFDFDGVLRLYSHLIGTNGSLTSSIVWSAVSQVDRCKVKGICGLNSYCTMDGWNLNCLCPLGFNFVDPNQPFQGCKENFTREEDCSGDKVHMNYTMSTLANTTWVDDGYAVFWSTASEEDCKQACLGDCKCEVAMFNNRSGKCTNQKLPLRYGESTANDFTKTFIKERNGNSSSDPSSETRQTTKKLGKEVLIVGLVLVTFSLIIFLSSAYLIYRHRLWETITKHANPSDLVEEINLRSFTYEELKKATDNFKEEIGGGGFGRVYKGSLPGRREIAVKKLEKMVEEGEREFLTEVKVIGKTHHRNLVRLLGFCSEGSNRLLVYEYMRNGSLANLLFNAEIRPGWNERVRITLEVARGILYLHEECETHIIHCDIKPHNILMDDSWTAKISDFGMAKLLMPHQTRTFTSPRGTRGYEAPEWDKNGPITLKVDVYSFGILLFEIICCRKKFELLVPEEEMILSDWVYNCYEAGDLGQVVGSEEVEAAALERIVKVGLWCIQTEPTSRPSIKKVVLMLEGSVNTPPLPSPASSVNG